MLVRAPEQGALDSFHAMFLYGCAFGDFLATDTLIVGVGGCSVFLACQSARQPSHRLQPFLPLVVQPTQLILH